MYPQAVASSSSPSSLSSSPSSPSSSSSSSPAVQVTTPAGVPWLPSLLQACDDDYECNDGRANFPLQRAPRRGRGRGQCANGSMGQWANGSMVKWFNGPMVQWTNGSMGQWANGSMGQWLNGSMGQWANRSAERAALGGQAPPSVVVPSELAKCLASTIGPLAHWPIEPLAHWPIGPLAH